MNEEGDSTGESNEEIKLRTSSTRGLLYDRIRKQVEHEDSLVNQRLNWLLLSQGFLFVAFGSLLPNEKIFDNKTAILCYLGVFGYVLALFTFFSISAAFDSLGNLRFLWFSSICENKINENNIEKIKEFVEKEMIKEGFPQITWMIKNNYLRGIGVADYLPLATMIIWIFIIGAVLWFEVCWIITFSILLALTAISLISFISLERLKKSIRKRS